MGERDAFGREKDEDALAEMGWRSSLAFSGGAAAPPAAPGHPAPEPPVAPAEPLAAGDPPLPRAPAEPLAAGDPPLPRAPASPPAAGDPPAPAAAPKPPPPRRRPPAFARRRRRRGPSLARLLITVAIGVAGLIGVSAAVDAGRGAVDGIRGTIDGIVSPNPRAKQPLYRAAALRAALAKLPAGRLVYLRVAAERIDAHVTSGSTRHIVQVHHDGRTVDVKAPAGPRRARLTVDPAAPARMIRTVARRSGRPASRVAYLVLRKDGWLLMFDDGVNYRATAAGRAVER
jgi:hypothetical protein